MMMIILAICHGGVSSLWLLRRLRIRYDSFSKVANSSFLSWMFGREMDTKLQQHDLNLFFQKQKISKNKKYKNQS